MGLKPDKISISFALSVKLGPQPHFIKKNDGAEYEPRAAVAADMQWQLVSVFMRLYAYHKDLWNYQAGYPNDLRSDGLFQMDLFCADERKKSLLEQPGRDDTLDRMVRRIIRENPIQDYLYAQSDYALDRRIHLYYKPLALIYALEMVVGQVYSQDEKCVGHLHMARQLLQRYEDFKPAPQLN